MTDYRIVLAGVGADGWACQFRDALYNALQTLFPQGDFSALGTYLQNHGFYTAPSSTRFHEAYEAGLLEHSCKVFNAAHALASSPIFAPHFNSDCARAEITVAALLHDLCKCDRYESYVDKFGKTCYKYADKKPAPFGHGATSAMLVQKLVPEISEAVLCAIRWHMSAWDLAGMDNSDIGAANKQYPLVHLIQFADQVSITDWY